MVFGGIWWYLVVSGRILVVSGSIWWDLLASGGLLQFGGIWLHLLVSAGIELATVVPAGVW